MTREIQTVWYATPERFTSPVTDVLYDDTGTLTFTEDGAQYRGAKISLAMRRVVNVTRARVLIPWKSFAAATVFCAAVSVWWADVVSLYVTIPTLAVGTAIGLLLTACMKWVKVEYLDEQNQPREAYFADASWWGWGDALGGNRRIHRALQRLEQGRT